MFKQDSIYLIVVMMAIGVSAMSKDMTGIHRLPADTRWFLQLDGERLRAGKMGDWVFGEKAPAEVARAIDMINAFLGTDLREKMQELVVFGPGRDERFSTFILRSRYERKIAEFIISQNAEYKAENFGQDVLHRFLTGGKQQKGWICFRPGHVFFSVKQEQLKKTLLAFDGKGKALAPAGWFAGLEKSSTLLGAADFNSIFGKVRNDRIQTAILRRAESAVLCLDEQNQQLTGKLLIRASDPLIAKRVLTAVRGLIATGQLGAPDTQRGSSFCALLEQVKSEVMGKDVQFEISVPQKTMLLVLEASAKE